MRFKHDCDQCVFLGEYGQFDLYCHPVEPKTVIARASSEPSDYKSGVEFSAHYPEMHKAHFLAIKYGMMKA